MRRPASRLVFKVRLKVHNMALISRLLIVLLLGLCAGTTQAQQPQFSMGLNLLSSEEYAALPKIGRYRAYLPPKVDLSPLFPPPGDQGKQSSCVAWAVAYGARSFYEASVSGRELNHRNAFSPAYVYNQLRDSSEGCNSGLNFRSVFNLIQSQGVASLSDFPYTDSNCSRLPSNQTKAIAAASNSGNICP